MKVLLCLLSDQHVPNLLAVHHFKPDRLVLIQTTAMERKQAAKHFLEALQLGGLRFGVNDSCQIEQLDAEDNLESVRKCLQRAYGQFPAAAWIANVSGGTKPMSIAAYEFFKAVGARLVYVNIRKPNVLLGLDNSPEEICQHQLTLKEFLAGYGFHAVKREKAIEFDEARARSWAACSVEIAKECPDHLYSLGDLRDAGIKKQWDLARNKGAELGPGHLAPTSKEIRSALCSTFGLRDEPGGLVGKLDKFAVKFVTGGWLETFFWNLLDHHAQALGIWDVQLELRPKKAGDETDCDLDVAFMHEYRMSVLECKSGAQKHDPSAEALHKVEAVIRQFGALGIRSYLATTSRNVLGQDGQLKANIRERSEIYKCRIVVGKEICELARNYDNAETVRRLIFERRPAQIQ